MPPLVAMCLQLPYPTSVFARWGANVAWYEPIIVLRPEQITLGDEVRIDGFVKLEGGQGLVIGPWVHIASFAHLNIGGGRLELGIESAVASGGKILSGSADAAWPSMSAAASLSRQSSVQSFTSIGARAVVCSNAVVLPGCHLGDDAILASGAVATQPIPPGEIWGGIPARFLRRRHPEPVR